ncbi:MAG: hypothetical protein PHH28_13120 [Desulfuromonadaceae bacterium]|nr:hypothetical protein [Desulfuromonadaceae bacterium]
MGDERAQANYFARIVSGFAAGFLATLIFHQIMLAALWYAGVAPFAPFSLTATRPFGVPAVFSLSFWGGIWGILFAIVESTFPKRVSYWIVAFLFGATFPSLIALIVVLPLKGRPLGGGWGAPLLVTAFLINGAWGCGTALFFKLLRRHS